MTEPALASGWYDDPARPGQLRWWDGAQWTDHVQPRAPAPHLAMAGAPLRRAPLAVPALVAAFLLPVVGFILGIAAMRQVNGAPPEAPLGGRGIAVASIIISSILTLLVILAVVIAIPLLNAVDSEPVHLPGQASTPAAERQRAPAIQTLMAATNVFEECGEAARGPVERDYSKCLAAVDANQTTRGLREKGCAKPGGVCIRRSGDLGYDVASSAMASDGTLVTFHVTQAENGITRYLTCTPIHVDLCTDGYWAWRG